MTEYCAECTELLTASFYPITALKVDIQSANAGQSVTLCHNCYKSYESRALLAVVLETESPSDTDPLTGVQYGELG